MVINRPKKLIVQLGVMLVILESKELALLLSSSCDSSTFSFIFTHQFLQVGKALV